jgi:DNA-binding response OmpR family regulator
MHLERECATREIPLIFVTAQKHAEDEARGLGVGAPDFIAKPLHETDCARAYAVESR